MPPQFPRAAFVFSAQVQKAAACAFWRMARNDGFTLPSHFTYIAVRWTASLQGGAASRI
jgi:hypothetical protein